MQSYILNTHLSYPFGAAAFGTKLHKGCSLVQSGQRLWPRGSRLRDVNPLLETEYKRKSNYIARVASQQDLTSEAEKFIEGLDTEGGPSVGKGAPELEARAVTLRQQYDALQAQVLLLRSPRTYTRDDVEGKWGNFQKKAGSIN